MPLWRGDSACIGSDYGLCVVSLHAYLIDVDFYIVDHLSHLAHLQVGPPTSALLATYAALLEGEVCYGKACGYNTSSILTQISTG